MTARTNRTGTERAGATGVSGSPSLEVVAVADAHPVLALPALLSLTGVFGSVTVVAAGENDTVAERVTTLLSHLLPTTDRFQAISPVSATLLGDTIEAASARGMLLLDVSAASPRAAIEAFRFASSAGHPRFRLSCFEPRQNRHLVTEVDPGNGLSAKRLSSGKAADIGSGGRVRPRDFLGLFGLDDLPEDPYPLLARTASLGDLRAAARLVLRTYTTEDDAEALTLFRHVLGTARKDTGLNPVRMAADFLPIGIREACDILVTLGLARKDGKEFVLLGLRDKNAFFFLSGGWLELVCHEALSLALPDRDVEINAGIRWFPESRRPEAEADVLFVHGGCLRLVSCKNDWDDERVFAHLRELRALVAEMGEGFVRPTLISTRPLTDREKSRAFSYEIGAFYGPPLLEALRADLDGKTGTFLSALLERGHGAPGPGRRSGAQGNPIA